MAESIAALIPSAEEGRRHDRTHMFVAATLTFGAGSCPVNIRNMSLTGALIEGAVLPERDAPVTLRRGSLQVTAKIVWRTERRAGVAFGAAIQVMDWMSRNPPAHQAQVDEIVRGIRDAAAACQKPASASSDPTPAISSIEAELRALKEELAQLENGLCNDMDVITKHPEIQLLDIALQRVCRLLSR